MAEREDWTEIETSCSTCGEPTEVEVSPDGRAYNGHFSTILVAKEDRFRDDVEFPTQADKVTSIDTDDNEHATVFVECPDCCPNCND